MYYPQIAEYIDAVTSAVNTFNELTHLRPLLDDDGLPIMSAGGFSVIFKMQDERDGKIYAVKCFTREQEGRNESYKLIADELEYVSSNYLTPIRYFEDELFVDTNNSTEREFPVLLMDWVEGKTLDVYIRENINNQYALEMLAYQFNKMSAWLITQPFAHGDLKPDNIIIKEDGQLVLVDYDGIYVPAMKGQKAREIGSPGFRHPLRRPEEFNEHIDDFAIASIALSLKAIALMPSLYIDYGGNDRLLFSERDFHNLCDSACFTALQSLMTDKEFVTLYGIFMIAWAENDLSSISYKLLSLEKKQKEDIQAIVSAYIKGREFIEAEEYEQAYYLFLSLARNGKTKGEDVDGLGNLCGNVLGANGLGYMYAYGYYVQQDYKKAADWFKQAEDKDFSMSRFNLGICYEKGLGVTQSHKKANRLYQIAAKQGFGLACDLVSWEIISDPDGRLISAEEEAAWNLNRHDEIISKFIL